MDWFSMVLVASYGLCQPPWTVLFSVRMDTAEFLRYCVLTVVVPGVVCHRLYHEWEVGSKLPLPRRIRAPQLVHIFLSYVHPKLQLQGGWCLLHHRVNHHLHDWTRWDGWPSNNFKYPLVSLHPLPVYSPTGASLRQDMMGGTVHSSEVIMRKRSENRAYTDEHIRDSIVMGDMSKFSALGEFQQRSELSTQNSEYNFHKIKKRKSG